MRRTAGSVLVFAFMFVFGGSAAQAVPPPCEFSTVPPGISLNHVLAKVNGSWIEPQGVCSELYYHEIMVGGVKRPFLNVELQKSPRNFGESHVDLAEVGIPTGTRMSIGVTLPPGANPKFSNWKGDDVTVGFDDTSFAVQGKTFSGVWEAGPGGSGGAPPACTTRGTKVFASMFLGGFAWQPRNADGSAAPDFDAYAGSFFYNNAEYSRVPTPTESGIVIPIVNCPDGIADNKEGFYGGFLNLPVFAAFHLTQADLQAGSQFINRLLAMRDNLATHGIDADFEVLQPGDLLFEPIDGVTFPALPTGSGAIGVRARGVFGYSALEVVTESVEARVKLLRKCQSDGGTLTERAGKLACKETRKPKVSLTLGRRMSVGDLGKGVTVSCNEPCEAKAQLLIGGKVAGSGHGAIKKPGKFTVKVKVNRAVRQRLSGAVDALLRLRVTDQSGNARTVSRKLKLTG